MKYINLNDDVKIEIVGSGTNTFGKKDNQYGGDLSGNTDEMEWAIENGYRHFDSAQLYNNEEVVGTAINNSSIDRGEFFITTKLNMKLSYDSMDDVRAEIDNSLAKLQTDYVDLFLLHTPTSHDKMLNIWSVLEDYYKRGVFKSIGVSNFDKENLDYLMEHAEVKPSVNQIKSSVNEWNNELIDVNRKHGVATVAWGPLGGIDDDAKQVLQEIGDKYGKTHTQVVLRYQIERDVIVIPKSHNKERQAQNIDVFDFELSDEDHKRIGEL